MIEEFGVFRVAGPMPCVRAILLVGLSGLCLPALADDYSTGAGGIRSQGLLGLTGSGIAIGQVEPGRPGLPSFDNAANSNQGVTPTAVFVRNGPAVPNANTEDHAEQVAGIMIGKGPGAPTSVARDAMLYSSARTYAPGQNNDVLAIQKIAQQNGGDVWATNISYGHSTAQPLDGSSLFSLGIDWSARKHNTLYVVAGNEGSGGYPLPTDSFNGIVVSASQWNGSLSTGAFREVAQYNNFNEAPTGGRRTVGLVAPGTIINSTVLGNSNSFDSGTSFAAPHVTGTVALLQEFATQKLAAGTPNWNNDARQHEVMKAVLMNSADKIKDDGTVVATGNALWMEKTIIDKNGKNWLQSDAYSNDVIPLDAQMGAGQLNAYRAVTQFQSGEYDSIGSAVVPEIGWDYGATVGDGWINKYLFDQPLKGGSFASFTLAWDRMVDLIETDAMRNNMYDEGETFTERGLTNLDLYLLPKGATGVNQRISASVSLVDSVEHIFFKIPTTGEYELWVKELGAVPDNGLQYYGLAWQITPVPEPASYALLFAGLFAVGLLRMRGNRRVRRHEAGDSAR